MTLPVALARMIFWPLPKLRIVLPRETLVRLSDWRDAVICSVSPWADWKSLTIKTPALAPKI